MGENKLQTWSNCHGRCEEGRKCNGWEQRRVFYVPEIFLNDNWKICILMREKFASTSLN